MMVAPTVNMVSASVESSDHALSSLEYIETVHGYSEGFSTSDVIFKSDSGSDPENVSSKGQEENAEKSLVIDPALMSASSVRQSNPGAGSLNMTAKYEHIPVSSLASPPESSNDGGSSPAAAEVPYPKSPTHSRQTSLPINEPFQRYTPESGTIRRASHSPGTEGLMEREAATPQAPATAFGQEADQESMRLIKELQAQDLGLRKRGKV